MQDASESETPDQLRDADYGESAEITGSNEPSPEDMRHIKDLSDALMEIIKSLVECGETEALYEPAILQTLSIDFLDQSIEKQAECCPILFRRIIDRGLQDALATDLLYGPDVHEVMPFSARDIATIAAVVVASPVELRERLLERHVATTAAMRRHYSEHGPRSPSPPCIVVP
jgi:hypothetical protein